MRNRFSDKGASVGVFEEKKAISKNPSDDLHNQEKNQYWTLYIDRNKGGFYLINGDKVTDQEKCLDKGTDQENNWPLRRGWNWNGGIGNTAACMEWLTLHGRKNKLLAACL